MDVERALRDVFAAAGCDGFLHARTLDGEAEVAVDADSSVISASVFKILVALELFRQDAAGELDARERVRVDPRTSLGAPAGLSLFFDEVEVSLRDLAVSMLTVSDAIATDTLIARIGIDRVNELARSLGLAQTVTASDVKSMFDTLAREVGFDDWRTLAAHEWTESELPGALERIRNARVCTPSDEAATRTTARETTRLLALIWNDEAAPPSACRTVRALMAKQLQRERVARAFKNDPDVAFAGKTGTFGGRFRNEAGVFEFPNGSRYAIAIFTSAHELYTRPLDIDDAIGCAAKLAIDALR